MFNIGAKEKMQLAGASALVTGAYLFGAVFELYDLSFIPQIVTGVLAGINAYVGFNLLWKKKIL